MFFACDAVKGSIMLACVWVMAAIFFFWSLSGAKKQRAYSKSLADSTAVGDPCLFSQARPATGGINEEVDRVLVVYGPPALTLAY